MLVPKICALRKNEILLFAICFRIIHLLCLHATPQRSISKEAGNLNGCFLKGQGYNSCGHKAAAGQVCRPLRFCWWRLSAPLEKCTEFKILQLRYSVQTARVNLNAFFGSLCKEFYHEIFPCSSCKRKPPYCQLLRCMNRISLFFSQ